MFLASIALCLLPQSFERISLGNDGSQPNDGSDSASISLGGRYVAFSSRGDNLVPGDTNSKIDVFVRDRQLQTTERISLTYLGGEQNNTYPDPARFPGISTDGQTVIWESESTNVVPGDTNDYRDIFVRFRTAGTSRCVSVNLFGVPSSAGGGYGTLSSNGRYVVFYSGGSDITHEQHPGIFLRDLYLGTTRLIDDAITGAPPSMSTNGRYFGLCRYDAATDKSSTYLLDIRTGAVERVSDPVDGSPANGSSWWSSVSDDGRYIAFSSSSTNLVPGTPQAHGYYVYVRDLETHTTAYVAPNFVDYSTPLLSSDGRFVALRDGNQTRIADMKAGTVRLLGWGYATSWSQYGAQLIFNVWDAEAPLPGDTNNRSDVYLWNNPALP